MNKITFSVKKYDENFKVYFRRVYIRDKHGNMIQAHIVYGGKK